MSYELDDEEITNIINDAYTLGGSTKHTRRDAHAKIMSRLAEAKSDSDE